MSSAEQLRHALVSVEKKAFRSAVRARALACPLCHERKNRLSFRDNRCSLRMCANCGLFFVDPYPAAIEQHQQAALRIGDRIELLDCPRRYDGERLYYDRHFASIAQECADVESFLDVGCGTGHLLERLSCKPDFYRAGLELNPQTAAFARQKSGCDIFISALEDFHSDRRFDVVTMINVFSHVPSFDGMFHSIRRLLSPRGKVILRTTEMTANVSRWNQVHWGIPDDLHFLGFETLDFICAKYGFSITRRERLPFEDELFRLSRWQQMGRSSLQNSVKRVLVRSPGALKTLREAYAATLGKRLFVSLIVLTPVRISETA